jgi:hypothetical protein
MERQRYERVGKQTGAGLSTFRRLPPSSVIPDLVSDCGAESVGNDGVFIDPFRQSPRIGSPDEAKPNRRANLVKGDR